MAALQDVVSARTQSCRVCACATYVPSVVNRVCFRIAPRSRQCHSRQPTKLLAGQCGVLERVQYVHDAQNSIVPAPSLLPARRAEEVSLGVARQSTRVPAAYIPILCFCLASGVGARLALVHRPC